jgi:hypothetical protein
LRRATLSALLFAALLVTAPAANAAGCPNEAIREAQGAEVMALPDCMALEQVSPAKKGNQLARFPSRISADGTKVVFNSFATLDPEVPNYNGIAGDSFIAMRAEEKWSIRGANLPYGSGSGLPQFSFTPTLTNWLQVVLRPDGLRIVREDSEHVVELLSPPLENLTATGNPGFLGSSMDQSHVYFLPEFFSARNGTFLSGDPQPEGVGEDSNLYVTHLDPSENPVLELAAKDLNGKAWGGNCGARLGGMESTSGLNLNLSNGNRNQGAISADGTHVYFSTRPGQPAVGNCTEANKKRIMVRDETPSGAVITELLSSECTRVAPACSTADGDDAYQGASVDQSKVYFTTTRQLASSDLDGSVTGTGNTTLNNKSVTLVTTATGTGTLASGQKAVTGVATSTGAFALGQRISGEGIPAATTIAKLGNGTLELSAAATASGAKALSAGPQPFSVGQSISGPNIAPGTTITAVSGQTITLSINATATGSASALTASGAPSCDIAAAIAGCDLYLYDADAPPGEHLTQVSAGDNTNPTPGQGANLYNSITAISADGSRVYFAAQGKLTTDQNPGGATAIAGQPNLYSWDADTDETSFIGTLEANDGSGSGLWGSNGTWNNGAYPVPTEGADPEVGGDGHILLFKSNAPLTADDTDGSLRDVYRYEAEADQLVLISKPGPGASNGGNASPEFGISTAPGTDYAQIGRPISEDGQTVEITTTGGLLPADVNGVEDIYLWKEGQIYRVPGSAQATNTPSNKPALSGAGSTLAFHTVTQILPSDGDTALDVYVARIGGGFPITSPPTVCIPGEEGSSDRCQGELAVQPVHIAPPPCSVQCENLPKSPPCPKGKVRKHGKCVNKPRHHKPKHKKKSQGKRAGTERGGKK